MGFKVSDIKVNELAKIVDVKPPVISKKYKLLDEPRVSKNNNRITGISPEEIEDYFKAKGFEDMYKTTIILSNSTVGGTGKTSTAISLAASMRRITSRDRPVIVIDGDSQASCTTTLLGHPVDDDDFVLTDYIDGRATLDDLLSEVNEHNFYVIGSNLNNIYLDKSLNNPKMIKSGMKKLLGELLERFPEGARIIIDTPPQLGNFTASCVCAVSQIQQTNDVISRFVIPVRPDSYSLKGAQISYREKDEILSTFSLPDIPTSVFITSFDKRMKIGLEIMRQLLQDELLQDHISPVMVRYSSEIPKANMNGTSIFDDGKMTPATADYQDLTLFLLGYESPAKGHA